MSKIIELTQNCVAVVDDHLFDEFNQWKWHALFNLDTQSFYAKRTEHFVEGGSLSKRDIYMHRQIADTPNGMYCDHINHDTLDNREENLRNVTNSQNGMNRKSANSNNTLGVLGVQKAGRGYRAYISINKIQKKFPVRKTLEHAISDRRSAESMHYGEYASKNV